MLTDTEDDDDVTIIAATGAGSPAAAAVLNDDPNNNYHKEPPLRTAAAPAAAVARGRGDSSSSDEDFTYIVLTCCDCRDLFPTRLQLLLHRLDAHSDQPPHQCPACLAAFKRPDLLVQHRRTHTADEPLAGPHGCPHCAARFSLKSHIKAHGRVLHPEHYVPTHGCPQCPGVFQSAAGLASHMRCHAEAGLRGTPKPFACTVCDCRFRQRSTLQRHGRKKHPNPQSHPAKE